MLFRSEAGDEAREGTEVRIYSEPIDSDATRFEGEAEPIPNEAEPAPGED